MHPVLERAWKLVPKVAQDAIAAGVDRARGVKPPPPPLPDPTKTYRLLVGPVNYAGQGYRWSRALETTGAVSARNYVHTENNVLQYDADYRVTWRTAEHSRAWQRSMLDAIGEHYTHVLIEACFPILGGMHSGDVRKQVALMQERGVKVGIVGHGTDIRLPSTHMQADPWSYFHNDVSCFAFTCAVPVLPAIWKMSWGSGRTTTRARALSWSVMGTPPPQRSVRSPRSPRSIRQHGCSG